MVGEHLYKTRPKRLLDVYEGYYSSSLQVMVLLLVAGRDHWQSGW